MLAAGGLADVVNKHEDTVRRFLKGFVDGIHLFRTDKDGALGVLAKYAKTNDAQLLEAYYKDYATVFPKVPYLDDIATKNPDARRFRPDRLYGGA